MSANGSWSPDEPLGTETFEQGDEALELGEQLDPEFLENLEIDPSIDPTLQVDDRELEEAGAELDDPESMAIIDGGFDDPDGLGGPSSRSQVKSDDAEGWDLDAEEREAQDKLGADE